MVLLVLSQIYSQKTIFLIKNKETWFLSDIQITPINRTKHILHTKSVGT